MCRRFGAGKLAAMSVWTTSTQANARPEQVLEVLTDPDAIRLWSPIDFDVEDLHGVRLAAGRTARVSGKLAAASISLRRGGGITGRLLSQATAALLSAGALDGAARSIARAAERPCVPALA